MYDKITFQIGVSVISGNDLLFVISLIMGDAHFTSDSTVQVQPWPKTMCPACCF